MTGLSVSFAAQARAFVAAFGLGVVFGVLYDAFFVLRLLFGAHTGKRGECRLAARRYPLLSPDFGKKEKGKLSRGASLLLTFILDFLATLIAGIFFLLFVYWQNDGVFRLYYLVAAALGFVCYYGTISRAVAFFSSTLVFLLRLLLAYLVLLVRAPLVFLLSLIRRLCVFLVLLLWRPLYGALLSSVRRRCAGRGFLPRRLFFE